MCPPARRNHQPMLDRIVMNIVDMAVHIFLISKNVIPIPLLPHRTAVSRLISPLYGERELDPLYDSGCVSIWVGNQQMEMVRQDSPSHNCKPRFCPRVSNRAFEQVGVLVEQTLSSGSYGSNEYTLIRREISKEFGHIHSIGSRCDNVCQSMLSWRVRRRHRPTRATACSRGRSLPFFLL